MSLWKNFMKYELTKSYIALAKVCLHLTPGIHSCKKDQVSFWALSLEEGAWGWRVIHAYEVPSRMEQLFGESD
jgi:hypothetical protein